MSEILSSMPPTADVVARALWEINKAAKRHRDAARAAFDEQKSSEARAHLHERDGHYNTKNRVLFEAIRRNWAKLQSVHRISGTSYSNYQPVSYSRLLACLDIAGFLFHCEIDGCNSAPGHEIIDLPPDWEVTAAPEGIHMSLAEAQTRLKAFLTDSEDDDDSEIMIDGVILRKARIAVSNELRSEEYKALASSLNELENAVKEVEKTAEEIKNGNLEDEDGIVDEELEAFEERVREMDAEVCSLIDEKIFTPDLAQRIKSVEDRVLNLLLSTPRMDESESYDVDNGSDEGEDLSDDDLSL